jgi:hypothetical protein
MAGMANKPTSNSIAETQAIFTEIQKTTEME